MYCAATQSGGIGVVFWDEAGSYAGGFTRKISHVISPNIVEILTAREGFRLTSRFSWTQIIVECDALQVVQAIGSLTCDSFAHGLLFEEIKYSLRGFDSARVQHVR